MAKALKVKFPLDGERVVGEYAGVGMVDKQRIARVIYKGQGYDIPATLVELHEPSEHMKRALQLNEQLTVVAGQVLNHRKLNNQPLPKNKQDFHEKLLKQVETQHKELREELEELFHKKLTPAEQQLLTS